MNPTDLDFEDMTDVAIEWAPPATDMESRGKPQWAHHGCGARWRNREAYSHCTVCHLTFTSDAAFAKHRTGTYVAGKRCIGSDQLIASGEFTVATGHLFDGQPTADLWTWKKAPK